jgi:hypothetical protein
MRWAYRFGKPSNRFQSSGGIPFILLLLSQLDKGSVWLNKTFLLYNRQNFLQLVPYYFTNSFIMKKVYIWFSDKFWKLSSSLDRIMPIKTFQRLINPTTFVSFLTCSKIVLTWQFSFRESEKRLEQRSKESPRLDRNS